MAAITACTLAFWCTVIDQVTESRSRMASRSQLKNPESARRVRAPLAPARRTRAMSSSQKRLVPRWEEPLRRRAWSTSPVPARVARRGW